jgi:hypothetical protein
MDMNSHRPNDLRRTAESLVNRAVNMPTTTSAALDD